MELYHVSTTTTVSVHTPQWNSTVCPSLQLLCTKVVLYSLFTCTTVTNHTGIAYCVHHYNCCSKIVPLIAIVVVAHMHAFLFRESKVLFLFRNKYRVYHASRSDLNWSLITLFIRGTQKKIVSHIDPISIFKWNYEHLENLFS